MSTASSAAENNHLPADQREAAAHAHLVPDAQADQAAAGTPQYGSFGKPGDVAPPTAKDGSNDNPDEFSELASAANKQPNRPDANVPGAYATDSPDGNSTGQRGHAAQNRDSEAVKMAQGDTAGQNQKEEDNTREAWSQDDERYAGGHAKASWTEQNDSEHDNN